MSWLLTKLPQTLYVHFWMRRVARSFWARSRCRCGTSPCAKEGTGARAGFSTTGHGSSPWVSTPAYPGVASSESSLILTHSYHRQGGGITVTPKTSDVVVVSPQAGNCFDMAVTRCGDCYVVSVIGHASHSCHATKDMIPPVRGNAYVLVVPLLGWFWCQIFWLMVSRISSKHLCVDG